MNLGSSPDVHDFVSHRHLIQTVPFLPLIARPSTSAKSNGTSRAAVDDVPEPQDGNFTGTPRLGLVDKDQGRSLAFLHAEMQARCLPAVVPAKAGVALPTPPLSTTRERAPLRVAGRGAATMLPKMILTLTLKIRPPAGKMQDRNAPRGAGCHGGEEKENKFAIKEMACRLPGRGPSSSGLDPGPGPRGVISTPCSWPRILPIACLPGSFVQASGECTAGR